LPDFQFSRFPTHREIGQREIENREIGVPSMPDSRCPILSFHDFQPIVKSGSVKSKIVKLGDPQCPMPDARFSVFTIPRPS
jgi:hypothetical protein